MFAISFHFGFGAVVAVAPIKKTSRNGARDIE
jgi:hypothetical protein